MQQLKSKIMKPTELMIGDLLQCDWLRKKYAKVCGISDRGQIVLSCGGFFDGHSAKPIPLTTEILEKNGFENDFDDSEVVADNGVEYIRKGFSYHQENTLVTWVDETANAQIFTDFNGVVEKEIRYVHELQHALRLCGLTKLADDFKI